MSNETNTEAKQKAEPQRKTVKPPAPKPNMIFTGKVSRWNKKLNKVETVPREAPAFIIDGANKISLPNAKSQASGFHLKPENHAAVRNLLPSDFKKFEPSSK